MPLITKIVEQKKRPNRRSIYLDGKFSFGCNLNVVAKFRLREGLELTPQQVDAIRRGEVRQECLDKALALLGQRLHSRAELQKKLARHEFGDDIIAEVLADLERLDYINDERFAKTKALSAAQYKQHGRRRAFIELLKNGVKPTIANQALDDVYQQTDTTALARQLAQKQAPRLRNLDPLTARRRLTGMLQRRGFDYDSIKPILDEVLGADPNP